MIFSQKKNKWENVIQYVLATLFLLSRPRERCLHKRKGVFLWRRSPRVDNFHNNSMEVFWCEYERSRPPLKKKLFFFSKNLLVSGHNLGKKHNESFTAPKKRHKLNIMQYITMSLKKILQIQNKLSLKKLLHFKYLIKEKELNWKLMPVFEMPLI